VRGHLGAGLVEIPPVPYRDPASAVLADPMVPESRRNCGTRFSFTPKLAAGDMVAGKGANGEDLVHAADRLDKLPAMDEGRRQELIATILRMALDHAPPGLILGCRPDERSLRFGLEQCYRAQARLATDRAHRIELVDLANSVRPRTLL
jgi:Protein kinase G tetratricopeptide repeat/Protein kinase G rubredoxin domain